MQEKRDKCRIVGNINIQYINILLKYGGGLNAINTFRYT